MYCICTPPFCCQIGDDNVSIISFGIYFQKHLRVWICNIFTYSMSKRVTFCIKSWTNRAERRDIEENAISQLWTAEIFIYNKNYSASENSITMELKAHSSSFFFSSERWEAAPISCESGTVTLSSSSEDESSSSGSTWSCFAICSIVSILGFPLPLRISCKDDLEIPSSSANAVSVWCREVWIAFRLSERFFCT